MNNYMLVTVPQAGRSVYKEGKQAGLVCGALQSQVPTLLHPSQTDPSRLLSATE